MHKYQPRFQLVRCSDPSMIQYPSLLNSNLVKYVNHLITLLEPITKTNQLKITLSLIVYEVQN